MCILPWLDEIFCRVKSIWSIVFINFDVSLLIVFVWMTYLLVRVLKSYMIIVLESICAYEANGVGTPNYIKKKTLLQYLAHIC
jgi:hypothetical protein